MSKVKGPREEVFDAIRALHVAGLIDSDLAGELREHVNLVRWDGPRLAHHYEPCPWVKTTSAPVVDPNAPLREGPRKPVSAFTVEGSAYVVCDDGTTWRFVPGTNFPIPTPTFWRRSADIPAVSDCA